MKKLLLAGCLLFQIAVGSAQTSEPNIVAKTTNILAALPANDKAQLEQTMQAISVLEQKDMVALISQLAAPDNDNNTSIEYAIGGYSSYVMQQGKETQRQAAVRAYCAALEQLNDNTNKQFIIYQLQHIAKDDAVPCLEKYITDNTLAEPATRALAQINTPLAQKVLFNALSRATGATQLSIIEALGYMQYKPAVVTLLSLTKTNDEVLQKVTLYALARIGQPAAQTVLLSAAQKAKYTFDNTNATSSYILYLHQLAINGNKVLAEKLAQKLLQEASAANQTPTRIAALKLITDINGAKSSSLLYQSLHDKNIQYRAAALQLATPFQTAATNQQWVKLLPGITPEAQVQLLAFISRRADKNLLPDVQKLLQSSNEPVRIAAISAIAKIGQQQSLPILLNQLKKGNADEIAAIQNAILLMKGDAVTTIIANAIPNMPAAAKVALLKIVAARSDEGSVNTVFNEIKNSDTAVHKAAVQALPSIVTQKNLSQLFTLLNNSKTDDSYYIQQAIINAVANMPDTLARTQLVLQQMNKQSGENQIPYFAILSAIGSGQALDVLQSAFEKGNEATKVAALTALSKTANIDAARTLLNIAATTNNDRYKELAVNGYLTIIRKAIIAEEQKRLMLEEAMELAQTVEQRQNILKEVGNSKTYLSLLFAGRYLEDTALQQDAANAVMKIALSNKDFNGDIVRNLLTKTGEILKGRDADYQRQAIQKYLSEAPTAEGFVLMFNGKDLTGWKGLVANPIARAKMSADTLAAKQIKADEIMNKGWMAKDGLLIFTGHGDNICTQKQYGDFEMLVDWKITKDGDAGIYLRGTPQVQIWDTARRNVGAQVGSGGLYNNQKHPSKPLVVADNAIGEWNTFHIIMRGEKVTVYLNGQLVTDNVVLENYWDRKLPIFPKEQIELQAHGTYVAYRNLYIKELTSSDPFVLSDEEKKDGFTVLFDGTNLDQWTGNKTDYSIDNNELLVAPKGGSGGNLYTKKEYGDFVYRFEFQLTPGANNGVGIRAPLTGDAAYVGMEIQVLDNDAPVYKDLHVYQYHGSVYGVIPAKRGFLKPVGEWNEEEIWIKGNKIKVTLNGEVILDGDIAEASKNGTADGKQHPGLKNKTGHIGFLGHGSIVRFRNIRVKEL